MATEALLEIDRLTKAFGGLIATHEVALHVPPGEAHAVIGPNGAGKTTLINQVAGHLRPDRGSIAFDGRPIAGLAPWQVARLGIGRSFQQSNVFLEFPAFENVRLAAQRQLPRMLRLWRPATAYPELMDRARAALDTVGLSERADAAAGELSHGERRQLELAMVLVQAPRLLLLDEPMAGLSLEESRRITDLLLGLKGTHTLVLVEHDMDAVFAIADRITVLVHGQAIATGPPAAIRNDPAVREAYLGED